jgi:2-dehydro-3-deoxyphosphooctonate aldolase (KDO 8-P synthase)
MASTTLLPDFMQTLAGTEGLGASPTGVDFEALCQSARLFTRYLATCPPPPGSRFLPTPNLVHLKRWNISMGAGQPLAVIAGLNVLENLDLALTVGAALKRVCADLGLPYVFKASFDKANRSSITSYRGPGLKDGLAMLAEVKRQLDVPIATDIHEIDQAEPVAAVADLVQIPAFLCRQTDLVVAAARATEAAGGWLHVKKAQFLAPWDCKNIIAKSREAAPDLDIVLCERGASFGYNNLVVDMLAIGQMQALGVPVTIDATHAVQLPGADPRTNGGSTGGRREGAPIIAKAAVAAGADGVFLEFHPDPDQALCDAPSCLPLDAAAGLLRTLKALHQAVRA